jgi:carboxymethylenebutenolidase
LNQFFKDFCERLASQGFVALAPDLYGGTTVATIDEAKHLRFRLKRDVVAKTLMQAVEHLRAQPAIKGRDIGVIGF